MDLQVPDSLEKRLKTLKGLPLTQQDIEGLTDSGEIGGRKLRFFSNMSQPNVNAPPRNKNNASEGKSKTSINEQGKSKAKASYYLQPSLFEVKDRSMTQYQPDKDFNLNVFVIDLDGKVVDKKKEKWLPGADYMKGELPYGCYLVVAWADCKGQRIGKCFHVNLGKSY